MVKEDKMSKINYEKEGFINECVDCQQYSIRGNLRKYVLHKKDCRHTFYRTPKICEVNNYTTFRKEMPKFRFPYKAVDSHGNEIKLKLTQKALDYNYSNGTFGLSIKGVPNVKLMNEHELGLVNQRLHYYYIEFNVDIKYPKFYRFINQPYRSVSGWRSKIFVEVHPEWYYKCFLKKRTLVDKKLLVDLEDFEYERQHWRKNAEGEVTFKRCKYMTFTKKTELGAEMRYGMFCERVTDAGYVYQGIGQTERVAYVSSLRKENKKLLSILDG